MADHPFSPSLAENYQLQPYVPAVIPEELPHIMDPDCAVCGQPATAECACEAKALDVAVRQAEYHMMTLAFAEVR